MKIVRMNIKQGWGTIEAFFNVVTKEGSIEYVPTTLTVSPAAPIVIVSLDSLIILLPS